MDQKLRLLCNCWNGLKCLLRSRFSFTFFTCAEAGRLIRSVYRVPCFLSPTLPQLRTRPAPTFPLSNSSSHSSMTVSLRAQVASRMASWLTAEISPSQVRTVEQWNQQGAPHCALLHSIVQGPHCGPDTRATRPNTLFHGTSKSPSAG